MTRTALQYKEILNDLFLAIDNYRKEYEVPVLDPNMRRSRRQIIFDLYDELHNLGNQKKRSWTLHGVHLNFKEPVSKSKAKIVADQVRRTYETQAQQDRKGEVAQD